MNFPLFVIDENGLDMFANIESLSSYIEAYDVNDNIVLDSKGKRLTLKIKNDQKRFFVTVGESKENVYMQAFLMENIKNYLHAIDINMDVAGCDLQELVILAIDKIGYS